MKIAKRIKSGDRTLLEMHLGQIALGLICQVAGLLFADRPGRFSLGLWFGVAAAMAAAVHMARTLDRAFLSGDRAAKVITRGYLFRYLAVIFFLVIAAVTDVFHPLVFFLGYMSLKGTAYLQPLTHKLLNRLLHETDPVPQPVSEEAVSQETQICAESDVVKENL